MKVSLRIILFLGTIIAISSCLQPKGIRVMSMQMSPTDLEGKLYSWNDLKPITNGFINNYNPDIIGLQYSNKTQIQSLLIDFPGYVFVGEKGPLFNGVYTFNPILFKQDQFEELSRSQFNLSDQPLSDPGLVTWVQLKYLNTGHIFFLFNIALAKDELSIQKKNALALLNQIRIIAGNAPVIITSDIESDSHRHIRDIFTQQYSDAYPFKDADIIYPDSTLTFASHIFINGYFKVERFHKIVAPRDGVLVLNNYPVLAELTFNNQPRLKPGDAGRLNNLQPEIRAGLYPLPLR